LPIPAPLSDPSPAEPRWSARRTLAFVLASSLALWAGIIAILRLLF
jgi:hypothetical protein